jgi:hypothetical protein
MLIMSHASTVLMLSQYVRQARTLRLYSNNVKPTAKSTRGDFTELSVGKGYAPVALVPMRWEVDPKKPTQIPIAEYPKVVFTFTEAVGLVYGYFVTNASGALDWAEWFEDGPYEMKRPDDEIKVTPVFALDVLTDVTLLSQRTA